MELGVHIENRETEAHRNKKPVRSAASTGAWAATSKTVGAIELQHDSDDSDDSDDSHDSGQLVGRSEVKVESDYQIPGQQMRVPVGSLGCSAGTAHRTIRMSTNQTHKTRASHAGILVSPRIPECIMAANAAAHTTTVLRTYLPASAYLMSRALHAHFRRPYVSKTVELETRFQ